MKRYMLACTVVMIVVVTSALVGSSAYAAEGPFYSVSETRLASGKTTAITAKASKAFVLVNAASKITITCQKLKLAAGAVLVGSTGANAGTSEEVIELSGCKTEGNGEGCKVVEPIKTNTLTNTLDYANKEKTGKILVLFAPEEGNVFTTIKFEGTGCKTKETAVEGSVAAEAWNGKAAIEVGNEPAEEVVDEVNFPATAIKMDFVEKGGALEEKKVSLKAFGTAATLEGRSEIEAGGKLWGVFTQPVHVIEFQPPAPGKVPVEPFALKVTIKNNMRVATTSILKNSTAVPFKISSTTCGATLAARATCEDVLTAENAGANGELIVEDRALETTLTHRYLLES